MPRQPRLDAPGTLHHVMGRGIGRILISWEDTDRNDFIAHLAPLAEAGPGGCVILRRLSIDLLWERTGS
jgi:hypothetical protein